MFCATWTRLGVSAPGPLLPPPPTLIPLLLPVRTPNGYPRNFPSSSILLGWCSASPSSSFFPLFPCVNDTALSLFRGRCFHRPVAARSSHGTIQTPANIGLRQFARQERRRRYCAFHGILWLPTHYYGQKLQCRSRRKWQKLAMSALLSRDPLI